MKAKKRAAVPAYEYEKLSLGCFRVIQLHPGTGSADIWIGIHNVLDLPPDYTAVSYVWGDTSRTRQIYATTLTTLENNKADKRFSRLTRNPVGYILITENLRNVLLGLRLEDEYRVLWIDSLCIDQDNSVEKSDQVQRMMTIYSMAMNTAAYLGEYDDAMKLAFGTIRILAALKDRTDRERELALNHFFIRPSSPASQRISEHSYSFTGAWNVFMAFLKLPWFHRVWIIQEVVLSYHPVIFAQKIQLPWNSLVQACEVVRRSDVYSREAEIGRLLHPLFLERARLATRAALLQRLKGTLDCGHSLAAELFVSCHFTTLQKRARGFEASDPRDHVFALMGIAQGHGKLLPTADYCMTLTEVYTRTAYAWYLNDEDEPLQFLGCVNGSYDADDLPTWVPDWRRPWKIRIVTVPENLRTPENSPCKHFQRVQLPDMSTPRLEMPMALTVRGIQLLTIKDVEPVERLQNCEKLRHAMLINAFPEPYPTTYMTYRVAFARILDTEGENFVGVSGPRSEGFWSYRLRNRDRHRFRPAFGGDGGSFRGVELPLVAKFHRGHTSTPSIYIKDSSPVRGPSEPQYTQRALYEGVPSHVWLSKNGTAEDPVESRFWFITDDGFMGLTTLTTKPGDVVVHLFGAHIPHVLRKKESLGGRTIWGYVGEVFVLGITDGEVEREFPVDRIEDFEMQ